MSAPAVPDPGRQLLDGLEALVRRHRALCHDASAGLHAELITAEVAQQLAVARRALRRGPAGRVVPRLTDAPFLE